MVRLLVEIGTLTAEQYREKFKKILEDGGFVSQHVFNCDETGLFWKKMSCRTYITKEETTLPGHKPMKDWLALLLCQCFGGLQGQTARIPFGESQSF
jgi:hypothetical protein